MDALLEVENLSIQINGKHGTVAPVRGVSLSVRRGKTTCVVGESGCGKSLTSLAVMGLLPRGANVVGGSIKMMGHELLLSSRSALDELRGNRVAMIFQEPMNCLNPSYTIGNQLFEVMKRHTTARGKDIRRRAITLLERCGIQNAEQRLSYYPHQLSGGQRQRVMIAMALMCDPDLLIADEPTTALDATVQAQILALLSDLQAEFGMGLLLVTHDFGVVARMADEVTVMYAGEIAESGPVRTVFSDPLHPYTRGLLRSLPRPSNVHRRLGTIPGLVPNIGPDFEGCSFRNRCNFATENCSQTVPVAADEAGRSYRCIHGASELRRQRAGESLQ
jgi:peptide/nickel transport system ATP-binding protein